MTSAQFFQRILVAVDAEGLAANAFLQGRTLAHRLGSKLGLVHAVQVPTSLWPGLAESEFSELRVAALASARRAVLERLRAALEGAGGSTAGEERLEELLEIDAGHPAKVILERVEQFGADLILLGHHARRPIFDFGSTARAILSRTTTPVWIQPEAVTPLDRILVPIDFSEHSRRALDQARALALRLGAALRVLHCYVPPAFGYSAGAGMPGPTYVIDQDRSEAQEELKRWMRELERHDVPAEAVFVEGEGAGVVAREILREAERDDLVVMGTHGRTGLSRFLIGSVAYAVLKHSDRPVLVIPSSGRAWQLNLIGSPEPEHVPSTGFAF